MGETKDPGAKGPLAIGVDFGTDSARALVVDALSGECLGSAVSPYKRWREGKWCEPKENIFRQHPLDYVESLEEAVRGALSLSGKGAAERVRGISVDTTGSTPCFADAGGKPLALSPAFAGEPDAMFILWKDHAAVEQAARINSLAKAWKEGDYTRFEGGVYSSEWFWAKALRVVERNPAVSKAALTIVEHCDWLAALLSGMPPLSAWKRSRCAAGHKAMWHASWGGYPSAAFLGALHPRLAELLPSLGKETYGHEQAFGKLCPEWAAKLGLSCEVTIGVGSFDAHVGAVGALVAPGTLVKIMGTSTCDITVGKAPAGTEVAARGICGQVDGSVLPGLIGYEAGQSAFGDIFAWFRSLLSWPLRALSPLSPSEAAKAESGMLSALEEAATKLPPGGTGVLALDWMNGRRTPDANQALKGAIAGLSLGTDAPAVYRALVEAAAFGSRAIVERFRQEGVPVERVSCVGGVARKSPFVMQVSADVLGIEMSVSASDQSCALGAAMLASVAAGLHGNIAEAQKAMGAGTEKVYEPDPGRAALYDGIYAKYEALGAFIEKETTL